MSTLTAPVPRPPRTPPPVRPVAGAATGDGSRRVLLSNVSWETYSALLADVGDERPRLTYDHGWLEIERPGRLHEQMAAFVDEMIGAALKRQRVPYEPAGSTTWRQRDQHRGLEADKCYHVQSVPLVAGKVELDLAIDPPPDLAVEVEVTSPLLDKVAVYRGLGVPEPWRVYEDGQCEMLRLDAAGVYRPVAASVAVPPLTPAVVWHHLSLRAELGHSGGIARFEAEFLATIA